MSEGNGYQAPHCDARILHAPGECKYCDWFPQRQQDRITQSINFTGQTDPKKAPCPAMFFRDADSLAHWGGNQPQKCKTCDGEHRIGLALQHRCPECFNLKPPEDCTVDELVADLSCWEDPDAMIIVSVASEDDKMFTAMSYEGNHASNEEGLKAALIAFGRESKNKHSPWKPHEMSAIDWRVPACPPSE